MDYIDVFMFEGIFVLFVSLFQFVVITLVWVFIIKTFINSIKKNNTRNFFKNNVVVNKKVPGDGNKYARVYNDVSKTELAKFNTDDIDGLKDYFYGIFVEFENAYNNLDYNIMNLLSTKELYQNYYTGITLDLKAGKKRIISDIEKKQVIIFELDSTIAKQVASVMIEVSYINYAINKHGNIISGSRENKVTEKFEVMFRKHFEKNGVTKCSSCGAMVEGNKCQFCRSTIKNVEFKISSIRKIVDQ